GLQCAAETRGAGAPGRADAAAARATAEWSAAESAPARSARDEGGREAVRKCPRGAAAAGTTERCADRAAFRSQPPEGTRAAAGGHQRTAQGAADRTAGSEERGAKGGDSPPAQASAGGAA